MQFSVKMHKDVCHVSYFNLLKRMLSGDQPFSTFYSSAQFVNNSTPGHQGFSL